MRSSVARDDEVFASSGMAKSKAGVAGSIFVPRRAASSASRYVAASSAPTASCSASSLQSTSITCRSREFDVALVPETQRRASRGTSFGASRVWPKPSTLLCPLFPRLASSTTLSSLTTFRRTLPTVRRSFSLTALTISARDASPPLSAVDVDDDTAPWVFARRLLPSCFAWLKVDRSFSGVSSAFRSMSAYLVVPSLTARANFGD
mmetsp:Transcript_12558/g.41095  ORF Transcript_12558/g.41095 Transcript_12558/m.41095 type:complete len:206 (-) Transcript_12558:6097-6714(-)